MPKYESNPRGEPGRDYDPLEYVSQLSKLPRAEQERLKEQSKAFRRTGKESPRPRKPLNQ